MIFFNKYFTINVVLSYPLQILLIMLIGVFVIILRYLIKYSDNNYDYKIYSFNKNSFFVFMYIISSVIFVLILRYLRWNFYFELKPFFTKALSFIQDTHILYSIILLEILLIFFLLMIRVKMYLVREIIKRHLYHYYKMKYIKELNILEQQGNLDKLQITDYTYYIQFINKLTHAWNYQNVIQTIVRNSIVKLYMFITNNKSCPNRYYSICIFMLYHSPYIFTIGLFMWDCIVNDYIVHKMFFYFPFLFLLICWKTISNFLYFTNNQLNVIIYERYYEEDNVLYINTTEKEDQFIVNYIKRGFRCYSHDVKNEDLSTLLEEQQLLRNFSSIFIYNRRFVKVDNITYKNVFTGESVDIRNNAYENI